MLRSTRRDCEIDGRSGTMAVRSTTTSQMTSLLGIDCATQPERVGLSLGELRDGVVRITQCRTATRREAPAEIAAAWLRDCDRALIALDAPLGWPHALGACLRVHRAGQGMQVQANDLFRRSTDIDIRHRLGKRPLEVGANLVSRTAVAALELLGAIRNRTGLAIPLAWGWEESEPLCAIEVYPAATRLARGAPDVGGSLVGLEQGLDWSLVAPPSLRSVHARDAAVCALAGADFLLGRAVPPCDGEVARIEAWIWAAQLRSMPSDGTRSRSR